MRRLNFLLMLLTFAPLAQAHWADLAAAHVTLLEGETLILLTFPTGLVAAYDDDGSAQLSAAEVARHEAELSLYLAERVRLSDASGQRAELSLEPVDNATVPPELGLAPGTHSTLRLRYRWPSPPRGVRLEYSLFLPGVSTASCLLNVTQDGETKTFVLTPENRVLTLEPRGAALWGQAKSFLLLGLEHILTGYDHLLFLIALLMLGGGLGYLLKVVSAFTMAHSLTLSLAVLGIIALPPRLVESLIALSIAYVAAENHWRKGKNAERWLLTFAFGLVHGLGFAGILQELALPKSSLALSLLSFNLGVEVGQIAVVAGAFALLALLKGWRWERPLRYGVSLLAVAAGLFWFVERAFLA